MRIVNLRRPQFPSSTRKKIFISAIVESTKWRKRERKRKRRRKNGAADVQHGAYFPERENYELVIRSKSWIPPGILLGHLLDDQLSDLWDLVPRFHRGWLTRYRRLAMVQNRASRNLDVCADNSSVHPRENESDGLLAKDMVGSTCVTDCLCFVTIFCLPYLFFCKSNRHCNPVRRANHILQVEINQTICGMRTVQVIQQWRLERNDESNCNGLPLWGRVAPKSRPFEYSRDYLSGRDRKYDEPAELGIPWLNCDSYKCTSALDFPR